MPQPIFLLLAGLILGAALTVVIHPNPVYSVCALVLTLFSTAVLFAGLGAHLIAVLQVIVYAGAIVVLFLFVVMLLNLAAGPREKRPLAVYAVAAGGAVGLGVELVAFVVARRGGGAFGASPSGFGTPGAIGDLLFTRYLLPFELTSLLLLVALVGAVVLARRRAGGDG